MNTKGVMLLIGLLISAAVVMLRIADSGEFDELDDVSPAEQALQLRHHMELETAREKADYEALAAKLRAARDGATVDTVAAAPTAPPPIELAPSDSAVAEMMQTLVANPLRIALPPDSDALPPGYVAASGWPLMHAGDLSGLDPALITVAFYRVDDWRMTLEVMDGRLLAATVTRDDSTPISAAAAAMLAERLTGVTDWQDAAPDGFQYSRDYQYVARQSGDQLHVWLAAYAPALSLDPAPEGGDLD